MIQTSIFDSTKKFGFLCPQLLEIEEDIGEVEGHQATKNGESITIQSSPIDPLLGRLFGVCSSLYRAVLVLFVIIKGHKERGKMKVDIHRGGL